MLEKPDHSLPFLQYVDFGEGGKPEYPVKKPSKYRKDQLPNSTHVVQAQELHLNRLNCW